jgi:hypothetical protein
MRSLVAVQEEAVQHAEENWETLGDAERRIFQDIARGAQPPTKHREVLDTISSTWFHGYGCCGYITTSIRYSYMNIIPCHFHQRPRGKMRLRDAHSFRLTKKLS